MRLSHARRAISARFDDPNLVSCAGLVAVMALAARCGLEVLLAGRLTLAGKGTAQATEKVIALVAGMVAGADSISDMDLLRHGGMARLFDRVRAPSTLGTFLRRFTFGHVRQLDAVAARLLARLAAAAPVLPGARSVAFLDLDDTVRQVYGYAKQGAGRGYTGVNGLNALLATLSTPRSVPVIAAARLRKGSTNSVRGAANLLAQALATARRAGATGLLIVRADSAFYGYDIINTCRRAGACFSVTGRLTPTMTRAIARIDEQAWTPIRYRNAIWDGDEQRWVSDAEVAEIAFTAFTGRRRVEHVTARLIVRRVRRLNPRSVPAGQSQMFAVYRYHAVFTDSDEPMLAAEATHRDHAIVEQVIADLKDSALAHLPSGRFTANAAWLACAVIAHNLTRAAGALAGTLHARARTGTLRDRLIHVPARLARSAGRLVLHLPQHRPWEPGLDELLRVTLHDPLPTLA
ncbi:IS1380 family transposase [Pseudonocardia sp. NPDC049635]|uniref:IS1380 family transposase n=1 Tax=Pseudonocardia sp. NPDC049635 TaxID=3155506 RepID=UPI0033DC5AED